MTGRSGEVADALERRKVKVCCVQETRWKGEGTRILRTKTGEKYKLFWERMFRRSEWSGGDCL